MVKASDINKDIRSIGEKVGVAVFSYDDIHNENINNEFHYDYERVIAEVSRLQKIAPEEAEAQLVKRGVLRPLPAANMRLMSEDRPAMAAVLITGALFLVFRQKIIR